MPHATLTVQTLLFARELPSGDFAVAPVVDPTLASFGTEASCIAEQRLFLTEYLARATPEIVARFALPDGVALREVDVLVPREGLPRRLQIDAPLRVASVVIPGERGAWVIVPALDHTFFVASGEDVEAAIRNDVARVAGALDLSSWQYLRLFPARAHALVPITIDVQRMERAPAGRAAARKVLVDAERRRWALEVLESVATPLDPGDAPPLVGRDAELAQLASLLRASDRTAVLVTGGPLEGKTALVRACVRGAAGSAPLRAYATSGSQLVAGMSGLGQWQERVRRVMDAAEALDAILYFDNLSDLLGDRPDGGVDIPSAMKTWLEAGRVRIVAELRGDLLEAAERRHFGFLAHFTRVRLAPLDAARTIEALRARLAFEARRDPTAPRLRDDAVVPLVDLAERYLPYQSFPGKAMRLYDELRAMEHDAMRANATTALDVERVYELFSVRTGVPTFLLRDDRALRLDDVVARLARHVIGQDEAVRRVAEVVCVVKAQLQPTGKPLATFLFVGPTGVGKTELARALATFLFASPDRMARFDMSEYADVEAAERLIRGTDRADGLLTRRVRDQPFGVVLLDEIEKAHPAVLDLLLQVCGEGRLTDARGRTAYFHDTIVILTSNLGATSQRAAVGFGATTETSPDAARAHYDREVARTFRPELVNRIDRVVTFFPLSRETIAQVTRIAIERLRARRGLLEGRVRLDVSDGAAATLATAGYSAAYGARALRRAVEDELVTPIAALLARVGRDARGATVRVRALDEARDGGDAPFATLETGRLFFDVRRAAATARARDAVDLKDVADIRREIDRAMSLDRVRQLGEQLAYLVTQLSYGRTRGEDRRTAHELSTLRSEHHRLAEIWKRVTAAQADAHAAEEVALMAMREGEAIDAFAGEARDVLGRFRRELVIALLAQEPQRDRVTLLVEDHSAGLGLKLWLAPLLRDLARRGWTAQIHAHGAAREEPTADWPASRPWGPPRDPGWLLDRLDDRATAPRNVLLRCEGPYAGVLLALEGGLHTFVKPEHDVEKAFVTVKRIAMRTALLDKEWSVKACVPDPPNDANILRRVPAVRELDVPARRLAIANGARALDDCDVDGYFGRLEEIALLHLLHVESSDLDRDELFLGPLDNDY
jgi:ATP-dependent Clp protease ATP-binding subunit ClpC